MKVAFDSRSVSAADGVGRYSRCLLAALRDTVSASDEILDTHRPSALARSRAAEVLHSPWMDGAPLHSPCPMVVTIHDVSPFKRRSERLRGGGLHLRLRRLALQRATHVIVPGEHVAREVVAELGLERGLVVVIPPAYDPRDAESAAGAPASASPAWSWEDAARATWRVYARAAARRLDDGGAAAQ